MRIVASLAPIVLLVGLGAALVRFGFYDHAFRRALDRLVYWVALPALFIGELTTGDPTGGNAGLLIGLFLAATAGALLVGWGLGLALRLPRPQLGVFVQSGFRGNLAFVGLPVLLLASRGGDGSLETRALLVIAPTVLAYNLGAVLVLELARSRLQWAMLPRLGRSIATNPLVLACLAGMGMSGLGLRAPEPIQRTLDLVGGLAGPLALLSLGGTLVAYRLGRHLSVAFAGALIKVGVVPVLAWWAGTRAGVDRQGLLILLVLASTPTAVASYVLAGQLDGDEELAASLVVLTTLLSAGSLAVALGFAG